MRAGVWHPSTTFQFAMDTAGAALQTRQRFWLTYTAKALSVVAMTEYVVTKQGATADWGSNAEGEVQEMPLSKPDGAGWTLHSVIPSQYNVMAVWERESVTKRKKR